MRTKILFFIFLISSFQITAQETVRTLQGVVLTSSPCVLGGVNTEAGIQSLDVSIPGNWDCFCAALSPFLGQPLNMELVERVRAQVNCYYQEQGCLATYISLPPQEICNGILYVCVQEATIGTITWNGSCYFCPALLARDFRSYQGGPLCQDVLLNDIYWLNRHPFHYTDAILRPGSCPGTTDIELCTRDGRPLRFYAGFDNLGTDFTGNNRLYAGFNWANALDRGDLFSYQYTCNPTLDKFQAHFAQYFTFLPWHHEATVYGGYATTHLANLSNDFENHGRSKEICFRYIAPLEPLYNPFSQELSVGCDWKNTNTNIFFADNPEPVKHDHINLFQLVLNYGCIYTSCRHEFGFDIEGRVSPFTFLDHQTSNAYNDLRTGANPVYGAALITLTDTYTFCNNTNLMGLLRLQRATGPLLSMEQFSLGGFASVRGYDEHAFLADDAVCFNLEYSLAPLPIIKKCDGLVLLGFFDFGWGHNYHSTDFSPKYERLMSVGPGLRYHISTNVVLRADYGFQLHNFNSDPHNAHFGKFHFGGQLSY